MRVGVLVSAQHSVFSSGVANTSLAVAEVMRELGHEVELIQMCPGTWWDDCKGLEKFWKVIPIESATGYDLLFEIDRMMLTTKKRAAVAAKTIWVLRKPFLLQELEASLFPTTATPKREMEGMTEIWIMDAAAAMEEGSVQALELLSRVPVRVVPFVWSPSPASTHIEERGLRPWIESTVACLKGMAPDSKMPAWNVHIAETNTTNGSCAVLPLVILREAKRRGIEIGRWKVHNSDMITKSKFFMDNIVRHCSDNDCSGEFVGRQRCVEWAAEPMSCVMGHLRFTAIRPMYLDLVWAGIPLVHNSPLLRDLGVDSYYSDNHIGEACDAFNKMQEDLANVRGVFAPEFLNSIRTKLIATLTPLSTDVKEAWKEALSRVVTKAVVAPVAAPLTAPLIAAPLIAAPLVVAKLTAKFTATKTLRIGFCDMWENFVPEYNFFTLMLAAAGAKSDPPFAVIGGPATAESNVVMFGPFGSTWKNFSQPKIHFTGENTPPVPEAALNLGFHHFDMTNDGYLRFPLWLLEIDWFAADCSRIVNPKPISVERCTKVFASDLPKKKFCAFVVSNPTNPVRNAAFQWLSQYKPVDSAGQVMNNMGPAIFAGAGGGGGELKKHDFLKDYKFCLAYENNSSRGYVTEKYLHAKAAGCIPIYWGDPAFERDFSTAGCIDARGFTSPEQLIEAVRRVDEDDSEWLKKFAVPALDSYRVAWAQRTMAECAKRIFALGGFEAKFAEVVGDVLAPVAPAALPVPVPGAKLETPIMLTCATRKYLPSLQHWLTSVKTQVGAMPDLKAIVFLSSDVPGDTGATLKEKFPFVSFEHLPETPPENFPDFWDPQHFGWKLWILNEISGRPALAGKMVFYTDAGAFLCRWPQAYMRKAQAGLCFLEDPREENRRWCSPEFCSALQVTEAELSAQQIQAAIISFRAGSTTLFREAMDLAKRREVLVGPKWAGLKDGKPYGHRHDQSILSILALRHKIPTEPLDTVYCDNSLRKTFTSGRAIYVHRGNFQVHRNFTQGINEAYVINLDRRADRLERLWTNCPTLKGRVERWSAIDGRTLELSPAARRVLKPNDFFWKKAVSGCAFSHLGLWSKLANEGPDITNYLILEDDVKFRPDWEKVWAGAQDDIPEDYDILYLGGVLPPNRKAFEGVRERVNDSFSRVKENTDWGQATPTRYFHFCAYAYVLSKEGARKVMDLIQKNDGIWTSADHVLCNPVSVLKAYVLDPMVAGCYQDDDPKYANSQFNDFSRIDGFDSDLWNNDERFTEGSEGELDIVKALQDVRAKAPVPTVAPTTPTPTPTLVPTSTLPRRFVCLADHNLDISQLHESEWLQDLFGRPSTFAIDKVRPQDPPPSDCPIVIVQRPHLAKAVQMLEKWDSYGAKFSILHLSDEQAQDDIEFYNLPACQKVLRFYVRENLPPKVTTIPLGFHWTLHEGSKNPLLKTPRLPFRNLTWSFFGTDWNGRKDLLQPLFDISGKYDAQFFKDWNDPGALKKERYISTLLDTVFVPCPDGMNPETFRFYEALECGCLPVLVSTPTNQAWVDWVSEELNILPLQSWGEAKGFVEHLMRNIELLEMYRTKVLTAWVRWRDRLKDDVKEWTKV